LERQSPQLKEKGRTWRKGREISDWQGERKFHDRRDTVGFNRTEGRLQRVGSTEVKGKEWKNGEGIRPEADLIVTTTTSSNVFGDGAPW